MKQSLKILNPEGLYSHEQLKATLILFLGAFIPAFHRYFGSISFARKTFPFFGEFESSLYMFVTAFVLMGVIPGVLVTLVFKESLRDYGLILGDWRRGLKVSIILLILIAGVLLYPASQTQEMRFSFPFDKAISESAFYFFRFQILRGLFFYIAWEFFFRGFMLFGLRKSFGDWPAICVQVIPSCLWHIGMPVGEIFSSLLAGFLFGIIAIRTRSIIWVFFMHYLIGVILDFFIVLSM